MGTVIKTFTVAEALMALFAVDLAVMVAVPAATGLTVPPLASPSAVATLSALLDQLTPFCVVSGGS